MITPTASMLAAFDRFSLVSSWMDPHVTWLSWRRRCAGRPVLFWRVISVGGWAVEVRIGFRIVEFFREFLGRCLETCGRTWVGC